MFSPVSSRVSFPALESNILQYWKDKDVFHRTATEREDGPLFMLFEGPPTANGNPGIHHVLARVFKDVICRHRTMKGYRCLRKGGWDTHGLPVELEVEKQLGLSTKREIEEYGIERFNQRCKESVFHYLKEWETMTDRIAFWVDMDDPYVTLHNDYIETGWWILKELWDKGLLYQDLRGTPHCPRCVTSLSSHEVALGYRENTPDPSVFIKFPSPIGPGFQSWHGLGSGARRSGLSFGMDHDSVDAAREHRSGRRRGRRIFGNRVRGRRGYPSACPSLGVARISGPTRISDHDNGQGLRPCWHRVSAPVQPVGLFQ